LDDRHVELPGDLRHTLAELPLLLEDLAEPQDHVFIDHRIGRVEHQEINTGVREQCGMAPQDPRIVTAIVTE
jgi:hypothetical protein